LTEPAAYRSRSLWLDTLGEPIVPRARLQGEIAAEVVIVGAGFIGLWSAYCLARAEPTLDIVVLEAEIAGFGAAGRNAGFVSAGIAGQAQAYLARGGWDGVRRAEQAMIEAIDHIGEVVAGEGIECGWCKSGSLRIATSHAQLQRVRAGVESRRPRRGRRPAAGRGRGRGPPAGLRCGRRLVYAPLRQGASRTARARARAGVRTARGADLRAFARGPDRAGARPVRPG
jgi:glycine/D-amino acid oxidase-like deaminating enzyme